MSRVIVGAETITSSGHIRRRRPVRRVRKLIEAVALIAQATDARGRHGDLRVEQSMRPERRFRQLIQTALQCKKAK